MGNDRYQRPRPSRPKVKNILARCSKVSPEEPEPDEARKFWFHFFFVFVASKWAKSLPMA